MASTEIARPRTIPVNGWLKLFILRFFVAGFLAFLQAASEKSLLAFFVGTIEISLGALLLSRKRIGLILTRIWLVSEGILFLIVGVLTDSPEQFRYAVYGFGALGLAMYFFASERVKATYPV